MSLIAEYITSLEFNPQGEIIATMERSGVCVISNIDTNNLKLHIPTGSGRGIFNIPNFLSLFHVAFQTMNSIIMLAVGGVQIPMNL